MEHIQQIELRKSRDIFEIINVTFLFIRENFRQLFKCVMLLCGPLFLIGGVVSAMFQGTILTAAANQVNGANWWGLYLLSIVIGFLAMIVMLGTIYGYVKLYLQNDLQEDYFRQVARLTFRSFFKNLLLIMVLGIMIFAGFFLFMFPGIYLMVALSLAFLLMAYEEIGVGAAISRSMVLISKYWWFTLGLLFMVLLINMVLSYISVVPYYVAILLISVNVAEQAAMTTGYQILLSVTTVFQTFATYSLSTVWMVALSFHYFNLVERKEGVGLFERVDKIAKVADAE